MDKLSFIFIQYIHIDKNIIPPIVIILLCHRYILCKLNTRSNNEKNNVIYTRDKATVKLNFKLFNLFMVFNNIKEVVKKKCGPPHDRFRYLDYVT